MVTVGPSAGTAVVQAESRAVEVSRAASVNRVMGSVAPENGEIA
jgi:hypothetical protein